MRFIFASRAVQVLSSLFAGLLIWEIAGWQFNSAFFAPVLGSDFAFSNAIAHWIANLFGTTITEPHPGTVPKLISLLAVADMREGYQEVVNQQGWIAGAQRAIASSTLLKALSESIMLFITGLTLAMGFGLLLGMAMARLPNLRIALEDYILALYSTPMAALIPFILAIFGFEFWPKVIVVFLFAVFPILYNTLEGARSLKPEFIEVARAFRSSERRFWSDVIIPFTLPFGLTGLRQGIGRALVGMVAAEILLNPAGIGDLLVSRSQAFDMAGVLAAITVVTVLGATLMACVRGIENHYVKWRNAVR